MQRSPSSSGRSRLTPRALLVVACIIALCLLAIPAFTRDSSALMTNQASSSANVFSTAAVFSSDRAYLWAQSPTVTTQGSKYRVSVTISLRFDSDSNGLAEASDNVLAGASLAFELRDAQGLAIATDTGTTDAAGQYTTPRFNKILPGSYQAVVTSITHGSETWAVGLDVMNPAAINLP